MHRRRCVDLDEIVGQKRFAAPVAEDCKGAGSAGALSRQSATQSADAVAHS